MTATKSKRITALTLTAALTLAGVGVTGTAAVAGDRAVQEAAQRVVDAGAPGYLARVDNGRRVETAAAGFADLGTHRRLAATDQFEIGSNTKMFTATLILQLVDRGRVRLDTPIERYLPGVVPNGAHITVRMLLNHTSGLFNYTEDPEFMLSVLQDPGYAHTEKELLDVAFAHEPLFAPGADWSYSNTNYIVAGLLAEKLTGTSLPDLVQQRIAQPLGLTRTYLADPRATRTGRGYAHGYTVTFAGAEPSYTDTSGGAVGAWAGAAGGIISTASDMSRFVTALLTAKLFSVQQLRQMQTTVALPAGGSITGGYGLGLLRLDFPCGTVWGHDGGTLGHQSWAVGTADGKRTAISDFNTAVIDLEPNKGAENLARTAGDASVVVICRALK
ncbi:serine hydrolase domain-containing protein [Actinoplanes derwentensis]|uniref:D-alanyl-D-alanine carboxypeptidase n=1 Tax=Actinoplanes derwentensis TaxID=113562 RepID=A0A1H2A0U4_9ACTN|nr:serine hydrolase domain-containing protein [Actinoplanes derwentensis]GID83433.1 serine hydrolase [Actinoplanes derwentensis]SDT39641.1 D-alanyl-D-alanine carboxypeptidase [Actinoplanes derwentensis]